MVGRIVYHREKGRGAVQVDYLGGLTILTASLYVPEGLSRRRINRRLARLEGQMVRAGVGRVVVPEDFPYPDRLTRVRPVETVPFYRAVADVLVMELLRGMGKRTEQGSVALCAPWLCPELRRTAQRLCPVVRTIRIDVPEEGEEYARCLQRQYGLPVAPPEVAVDVTVAFGPCGREQGQVLRLYGEMPQLGRLRLRGQGLDLPGDCDQQLLALLWEMGAVRREDLYGVVPDDSSAYVAAQDFRPEKILEY